MSRVTRDYKEAINAGTKDHMETKTSHPIVKNSKTIIIILIVLYVLFAFGLVVTYMKTRCPYTTLTACQVAMRDKCGEDRIGTVDACANFVQNVEPCYCKECVLCLNAEQRAHCNASQEDRMRLCEKQMQAANAT